jgi:predicted transcriptional regulator
LLGGSPAIVVLRGDTPFGLISRFDFIKTLINQDQHGI